MTQDNTQVLLADDNDANRFVARTILERSGYKVTQARNGPEALILANSTPYDFIILDAIMPLMDGIRALRRLRRTKGPNQNTPVFVLTSYSSVQDQQRYIFAGFDYVLAKPLRAGAMESAQKHYESGSAVELIKSLEVNAPQSIDLIDETLIEQIFEYLNEDAREEIQNQYWASITRKFAQMETNLLASLRGDSQSLTEFRRAVHAVKSASSAIGLSRVAFISRRLQNAPPSEISSLMSLLLDALTASRPALIQVLIRARQFDTPMKMGRENESKPAHHNQNNCATI